MIYSDSKTETAGFYQISIEIIGRTRRAGRPGDNTCTQNDRACPFNHCTNKPARLRVDCLVSPTLQTLQLSWICQTKFSFLSRTYVNAFDSLRHLCSLLLTNRPTLTHLHPSSDKASSLFRGWESCDAVLHWAASRGFSNLVERLLLACIAVDIRSGSIRGHNLENGSDVRACRYNGTAHFKWSIRSC